MSTWLWQVPAAGRDLLCDFPTKVGVYILVPLADPTFFANKKNAPLVINATGAMLIGNASKSIKALAITNKLGRALPTPRSAKMIAAIMPPGMMSIVAIRRLLVPL